MREAVAIIPARMGSTRFPGKALASETGKPLVVHVAERARAASRVGRVVVATDHPEIQAAVVAADFEVVMTDPAHENGTSRLAEASEILKLVPDAVVVNVQGDEPELDPETIDAAVDALLGDDGASIGTAAAPCSEAAAGDPNVVKAVVAPTGRALYFSRAPVPCSRDGGSVVRLQHIGVYVYRAGYLRRYAGLPATPLELAERLEQLRAIEHGDVISVAVRKSAHTGIDTPEEYRAFVGRERSR